MRLLHAMLLLPLFGVPAIAQSATPPTTEQHGRRTADQHFADANTTHDGRLTLDQATAGYKSIAKAFSQIDVNHHGYVTIDDIKTWKAMKKAARLAAKQATTDSRSHATTAGELGLEQPGSVRRRAQPSRSDTSTSGANWRRPPDRAARR